MPKQEIEEDTPRSSFESDEDVKNNEDSINFDEFFDLAVYKNQFLNSQSMAVELNLSLFLIISILYLYL